MSRSWAQGLCVWVFRQPTNTQTARKNDSHKDIICPMIHFSAFYSQRFDPLDRLKQFDIVRIVDTLKTVFILIRRKARLFRTIQQSAKSAYYPRKRTIYRAQKAHTSTIIVPIHIKAFICRKTFKRCPNGITVIILQCKQIIKTLVLLVYRRFKGLLFVNVIQ